MPTTPSRTTQLPSIRRWAAIGLLALSPPTSAQIYEAPGSVPSGVDEATRVDLPGVAAELVALPLRSAGLVGSPPVGAQVDRSLPAALAEMRLQQALTDLGRLALLTTDSALGAEIGEELAADGSPLVLAPGATIETLSMTEALAAVDAARALGASVTLIAQDWIAATGGPEARPTAPRDAGRAIDRRIVRSGLLAVMPAGEEGGLLAQLRSPLRAGAFPVVDRSTPPADLVVLFPGLSEALSAELRDAGLSADLSAALATAAAALHLGAIAAERGLTLDPASLEALLLHTARDIGEPGPDEAGWGVLDPARAADTLLRADRHDAERPAFVGELLLAPGEQLNFPVIRRGDEGEPLTATLVFHDPADAALDLTLATGGGVVVHSWVAVPGGPARRGRMRGRSGRVDLPGEAAGEHRLRVVHRDGGTPVRFSLVITGGVLAIDPARVQAQSTVELGGEETEAHRARPEPVPLVKASDEPQAFFHPALESGQVAEFTGAASYSFPIEVPTGAGGLGPPPLALRYSSDSANTVGTSDGGWLGVGWSFDVGRVELSGGTGGDHRVVLGGSSEKLVYRESQGQSCADADGWLCDGQSLTKFNAAEARFWRIEKTSRTWSRNACTCTDTCSGKVKGYIRDDSKVQVWNRSGVRYDFGTSAFDAKPWNGWVDDGIPWSSSRGYYLKYRDGVGPDIKEAWFRSWGLEKIVDPHGNTVEITYRSFISEKWHHNCQLLPEYGWKEVYPHRIRYTTNPAADDHHAEWEVEMVMSEKAFDTLEDHGLAQSGVRLDRIKVWYRPLSGSPILVREYVFGYGIDQSGATKSYRLTRISQYGAGGEAAGEKLPDVTFGYEKRSHKWDGTNFTRWVLNQVDNGYGASTRFVYTDYESGDRYRKAIVTRQETDADLGPVQVTDFAYDNPKHDLVDGRIRRLIGFNLVEKTRSDHKTVTGYHVAENNPDHPLTGKLGFTTVQELDGTARSQTHSLWGVEERYRPGSTVGAGWFVYESERREYLWGETGSQSSKRTTFHYNPQDQGGAQHGNLIATREYDHVDATVPFRSTWRPHAANTAAWIVDKLRMEAVFAGDLFQGDYLEKTVYIWEPGGTPKYYTTSDRGLLYAVRRYDWNGGAEKVVDTRHWYDAFGNRTATRTYNSYGTSAAYASGSPRLTSTVYDADHHTFPTRTLNPLGHRIDRYYYNVNDPGTAGAGLPGQLRRVRDVANGVWTEHHQYDAFGRPTHLWLPGSATWAIGEANKVFLYDDARRALQERTRTDTGVGGVQYLDRWTFFDGLGRLVQTLQPWKQGVVQITHRHYDAEGRLERTTIPVSTPWSGAVFDEAEWSRTDLASVRHTYDALGRPKRTVQPNNLSKKLYYYGAWGQVTEQDELARRRVNQVYDRRGNPIQTWEKELATGTTYRTDREFDALGRVVKVIDQHGNETESTYDTLGRPLTLTDPDRGRTTYRYDAAGNVTVRQNALGQRVCLYYDVLDRVVAKDLRGSACPASIPASAATFTYDGGPFGAGRLRQASNSHSTQTLTYDDRGRTLEQTTWIAAAPQTYVTAWSYDHADRIRTTTHPTGEVVSHGYSPHHGRAQNLTSSRADYVPLVWYNERFQLLHIDYGNGLRSRRGYGTAGTNFRLATLRTGPPGEVDRLQDLHYLYDGAGNTTKLTDYRGPSGGTDATSEVQHFTYDFLDRLTEARTAGSTPEPYHRHYTIDPIGNLSRVRDTVNGLDELYTYPTGRPHAATKVGSITLTYDAAGRMKTRKVGARTFTFTWDAEDRLTVATDGTLSVRFLYDANSNLVRRKVIQGTATAWYFMVGDYYEEAKLGATLPPGASPHYKRRTTLSIAGRKVAMRWFGTDGSDLVFYFHPDAMGGNLLTTTADAEPVREERFFPFGESRWSTWTDGMFTEYAFNGERRDDFMDGMYHMGARVYDPRLRRWLSADSIVPDPGNPQALNRYAYVYNQPLSFTDPSGHDPMPLCRAAPGSCDDNDVQRDPPDAPDTSQPDRTVYTSETATGDAMTAANVIGQSTISLALLTNFMDGGGNKWVTDNLTTGTTTFAYNRPSISSIPRATKVVAGVGYGLILVDLTSDQASIANAYAAGEINLQQYQLYSRAATGESLLNTGINTLGLLTTPAGGVFIGFFQTAVSPFYDPGRAGGQLFAILTQGEIVLPDGSTTTGLQMFRDQSRRDETWIGQARSLMAPE